MGATSTPEYAAAVREMIAHENVLLNNRMSWMLVAQGLLYAAVGSTRSVSGLIFVLIGLGLLVSLSSLFSAIVSRSAVGHLLGNWDAHLKRHNEDWRDYPPVIGARLDGGWLLRAGKYVSPPSLLPVAFAVGWILVLVLELAS